MQYYCWSWTLYRLKTVFIFTWIFCRLKKFDHIYAKRKELGWLKFLTWSSCTTRYLFINWYNISKPSCPPVHYCFYYKAVSLHNGLPACLKNMALLVFARISKSFIVKCRYLSKYIFSFMSVLVIIHSVYTICKKINSRVSLAKLHHLSSIFQIMYYICAFLLILLISQLSWEWVKSRVR